MQGMILNNNNNEIQCCVAQEEIGRVLHNIVIILIIYAEDLQEQFATLVDRPSNVRVTNWSRRMAR
jgi:hypothetical protein